ncbi:MAG: hypothetical protein ACE5G1_07175 [bacterium]
MVHLKKHNETIKLILSESQSFFVKNIKVGQDEVQKIRSIAHWTPDLAAYKFYYGKDSDGNTIGDVLFVTVNSKHGPFTLAVGFSPQNTVTRVILTDIPVEPLSWVRKLLQKNFLDNFAGKPESDLAEVINTISKKDVGAMPHYYAKIIIRGVERALLLQNVLFGL